LIHRLLLVDVPGFSVHQLTEEVEFLVADAFDLIAKPILEFFPPTLCRQLLIQKRLHDALVVFVRCLAVDVFVPLGGDTFFNCFQSRPSLGNARGGSRY
jgi:hypothetical protein